MQVTYRFIITFFFIIFYNSAIFTLDPQTEKLSRSFQKAVIDNEPVIYFSDDNTDASDAESTEAHRSSGKKPWTIIVYMAADNDLRAFAHNNIRQMSNIGSNQYVNILIHMDIRYNNNQKVTRRYFVEKNKVTTINERDPNIQNMDSGDPKTLISCCEWGITNYPAENYALILWNHGTGIIDPRPYKIINPAELFTFNPDTSKFELDRTMGFLDLLYFMDHEERGICWDNSTGNYLTNAKFEYALEEICRRFLNNKKFSIVAFDACLMSMVEIANILKKYSDIMVGSQEVELGTGWNYQQALAPLADSSIDKYTFAKNIVAAFQRTYSQITNDYTQSAIDLKFMSRLEHNIHEVAYMLNICLDVQENQSVTQAIKAARNKRICTHFDEPSYIDLYCFYNNLEQNVRQFTLQRNHEIKTELIQSLKDGKSLIQQAVFANTAGKNLKDAQGLSIYFPESRIHSSYEKTEFAKKNNWFAFITGHLKKS